MIEEKVISYLNGLKLSADVYAMVPATKPNKFFVIQKTGSSRINGVDSSTIAIQSYGSTLLEAATMNQEVKDAMLDFIEEPYISAVELNGDYNYTDTAQKQYRYQAVFVITHY